MSGFGSSILIEAAPPLLPACLIRNAGWLYSGFMALTSKTADAESRAPSLVVIVFVAIVFLLYVGLYEIAHARWTSQHSGCLPGRHTPSTPLSRAWYRHHLVHVHLHVHTPGSLKRLNATG